MDDQHELAWLAFQYIAGDLSCPDREVFERRLAEDQAAREAVAAMVDLVQCVEAAELEMARVAPATSVEATSWARAAWVALSTVACLVMFVAIHGMPGPDRIFRPGHSRAATSVAMDQLAIIWSENRGDWEEPLLALETAEDADDEVVVLDAGESEALDGEPSTDWIRQAVFGMADRARLDGGDDPAQREI